jgi:murein L,D-transpeptidase YcbB/YkuD
MKKFLINEEEKNRILDLHKKFIAEQGKPVDAGFTFVPVKSQQQTQADLSQMFAKEKEGEMSGWVFDRYKIGDYSEDPATTETDPTGEPSKEGGGSSLKEITLTVDDLKNGKSVSMGMKGPVVGEIQKLLISAGYTDISKSGDVDNIFGRRTKSSVEKFQSENKNEKDQPLKKDGIVGPETIKALLKKSDEKMRSSAQAEIPKDTRLDKDFGVLDFEKK